MAARVLFWGVGVGDTLNLRLVALRKGECLDGYRVDSVIGEGGCARIYRARDLKHDRPVALKVPRTRYPDETTWAEFDREFVQNRKLHHPNVLRILELFEVRGSPVLVTPLGRRSLAERLTRPLPLAEALRFERQLLLALAHSHQQHVIHCDVKPDNLLFMPSGRLVLSDFGSARRGRRTVAGDGSGTKGYMPPEQLALRPSARSDVFAAGVVFDEMLFGARPSGRQSARYRKRRLPKGVIDLIERAVAIDPTDRYRDATEMLEELRRFERRLRTARRAFARPRYRRPRHY